MLFVGIPIIHGAEETILILSAFLISLILSILLTKKYARNLSINELIVLTGIGNAIGFFVGAMLKAIFSITGKDEYSLRGVSISFGFALIGTLILDYFAVVKGYFKKKL